MKGEHFAQKEKTTRALPIVNVAVMGVLTLIITLALLLLEHPTVSETEKRELTKFPEFSVEKLLSGEYTAQISDYYSDTVPNRDFFKTLSASFKKLMGLQLGGTTAYGGMEIIKPVETTPEATTAPPEEITTENNSNAQTTPQDTTAPEETTAETTTEPKGEEIAPGVFVNGQIVVKRSDGHYWGISMFGGGSGERYAGYINDFRSGVGNDVNVFCMVVPTSSAYYTPSNFADYNASHLDSINSVYDNLDEGVVAIDAYGALALHTDEPIYTRTDHHWQPLGAYYAAQEFARVAELPFAELETMEVRTYDDYMGSLYTFTQDQDLYNDPEVFTYYVPANDFSTNYFNTSYEEGFRSIFFLEMDRFNAYSTFMGGDQKIVRVDTDVNNGRKLAVIKDSYGNAEIPFFMNSFEQIYVIDMRYFDLNIFDFVEQEGITDVLFTCCTFSAVGPNAEGIHTIQTN